jgi:glutathione S-transferase
MITLYHCPRTRSSRIIWLLEELGAPYAIEPVSIFRPSEGSGEPDPRNPHPDKRVPAIEHNGALVAESVAIVLYLTDAYPQSGLGPVVGDPRRGDYLTWIGWYAAEMEPAMFAKFGDELGQPNKRRSYEQVVARLENTLARQPYVLGEQFTAADILVGSALQWARSVFPESPTLDAYMERVNARPALARANALDEARGMQTVG